MSSEAITQNDLREILSRTVGSIPSEYKKLLWTNPNPTSDFGAQTLTLDLSGYDEVEIVATFLGDTRASYSTRCAVGAGSNLAYQILNTATATNASTFINGVAREFTVSTSGITFGNGQMTYNGGAYTNWQSRAIPYKIYGIKYEYVQPPAIIGATDYIVDQQTEGHWTYRIWNSGIIEAWYYASVPFTSAVNQTIGYIPTAIQPFTTPLNLQINGTGNGFVGDLHHLWVTNNEVYITPTTAGTYATSVYLCFKN